MPGDRVEPDLLDPRDLRSADKRRYAAGNPMRQPPRIAWWNEWRNATSGTGMAIFAGRCAAGAAATVPNCPAGQARRTSGLQRITVCGRKPGTRTRHQNGNPPAASPAVIATMMTPAIARPNPLPAHPLSAFFSRARWR